MCHIYVSYDIHVCIMTCLCTTQILANLCTTQCKFAYVIDTHKNIFVYDSDAHQNICVCYRYAPCIFVDET